jgi:hypothetical protein
MSSSAGRFALKEWASVCDRLGRGEHILLVRKGGILDRSPGFEVIRREFFLFPTRFHEKGEAPPDRVELGLYARVHDDVRVPDLEALRRLEGQHAVPWDDVERRFHYGKEKGVHVLAVRVFRLERPVDLPDARVYDGCRSWVELAGERAAEPAEPVLDDGAFARKLEAFRSALHG